MVPLIEVAADEASRADVFLVVGTSLLVYPAAGLIDYVAYDCPKFIVDPKVPSITHIPGVVSVAEKASTGLEKIRPQLVSLS